MKGSYYQMKDKSGKPIANRYRIQIYTGTGSDGQPGRHTEVFHGRKGEVQKRIAELTMLLDKGVPVPTGRLTVAEHLDQWLEGYAKTRCSPRTVEGYRSIIKHHLAPALGHLQLKELQPTVIQRYYGKACETRSKRTVRHHHRVLSESLKYAVRQGILGRNPCEWVDPPKAIKKTMRFLAPDEADRLLKVAAGSQYYPVIYMAISTGLRQAELLGLRWRDVDVFPVSASVSVSQVFYKRQGVSTFKEPKTAHSRRRVPMTPKLASYMASYKAEREAFHRQLEKPLTLDDLVFTTVDGRQIDPSVLSHEFAKIAKRAGLSGVRFHDLRHTFASLMLLQGVSPKVVSEMLGHASAAFTMDTYQHIINGMQQDAATLLDKVLPAGVSRENNTHLTHVFSNS